MKRAKSTKQKVPKKSVRVSQNFEDYLRSVPENARAQLNLLRATIRSVLPPATIETISYRIPAFRNRVVLVWFAAFAQHCSLFPTAAVIEAHKSELANFHTSKGTVHFPLDKPLPTALIKKLVRTRLRQSAGNNLR
jgi:uncharacterized protein YdhG (YjbR/CyaY superfamily)